MNRRSRLLFSLLPVLILLIYPGPARPSGDLDLLRKEMEAIREGQREIQKDLEQIKNILRARGLLEEDPQNLFINIPGRPFKGDPQAKLVLIEFSEYE